MSVYSFSLCLVITRAGVKAGKQPLHFRQEIQTKVYSFGHVFIKFALIMIVYRKLQKAGLLLCNSVGK